MDEHFLNDTEGFVIFHQSIYQPVKFFQILFTITRRNHDLARKEPVLKCVAGDDAFSPRRFRPGGAQRISTIGLDSAFRDRPLSGRISPRLLLDQTF